MATRLQCSFCLRSDAEVRKLVAGAGGGYICDTCAIIAVRIMADSSGASAWARLCSRLGKLVRGERSGVDRRAGAPA
jgi:hypothetical protein